jgi:hypothetical protein
VPISAQLKYNIDVVCEYIVHKIPVPVRGPLPPPSWNCPSLSGKPPQPPPQPYRHPYLLHACE